MTDLAKWRSHKIVSAGKILELVTPSDPGTALSVVVTDSNGERSTMSVARQVFARGYPEVGDYLVIYEPDEKSPDGYVSWSPAKAFEDGYSRL